MVPDIIPGADPDNHGVDDPWPRIFDAERKAYVAGLLAKLTARQRDAVRLTYFEGMSDHAIAVMWGVTEETVRRTRMYAINRMQAIAKRNDVRDMIT